MAYEIFKKLNIRPQYNSPVVVHVSSGDSGIPITFEMYDGAEPYTIPSGSVISVQGTRKDGASWITTGTASGNEITFTSPSAMAAVEGAGIAEVSITSGSETYGSANFLVLVERASIPNGVSYSSDPSVFQEILNYVKSGIAQGMQEATSGAVAEWLEENITPTTPAVDASLTVSGAAADAAVVGGLKNEIGILSDSAFELQAVDSVDTASGWRLNKTDGLCSSNSSYKMVKYRVVAGQKLRIYSDDRFQFQTAASVPSSGTSNRVGITYGSGDFLLDVPDTATYLIISTPTASSSVTVYSLTAIDNMLVNRKEAIDYVDFADFQLGDLYVSSSGSGTYYSSPSRMRTIKNSPITLYKGDIIGVKDLSQAVFVAYRKTGDSSYEQVIGWSVTGSYLVTINGEYEILLRYPTEATITDPDDLASNFYIKRFHGIVHETSNIQNMTDVFNSELETTITTARNKTTSKALMFGIITDTHLDNKRVGWYMQTLENLERLNNGLEFNGIIHLGDIINGYDSKDIAKYHLGYAVNSLLKIAPNKTYITVGNHDNDSGAGDSQRLTDKELYSYIERFNEQYVHRTMTLTDSVYENAGSNFYVDYDNFKIRAIFFDSCYYSQGFSEVMMSWFVSVINNAPSDYKFVLFTHMSTEAIYNGGSAIGNATEFKNILAQYNDRILCYIHGHTHYDAVYYTDGFVHVSLCSCVPDQPSSNVPSGATQPTRTIGTITQDCINVVILLPDENKLEVIRFGAGDDMTIPFRNS